MYAYVSCVESRICMSVHASIRPTLDHSLIIFLSRHYTLSWVGVRIVSLNWMMSFLVTTPFFKAAANTTVWTFRINRNN